MLSRTAQRKPGILLNILIIGIDSLSHASARQKLPKVYKYLKDELGAMIFNGQSIVGDGTTEQMTATLTVLGELEKYESRRHHKNPKPADGWSWIYKQLKGKQGARQSHIRDCHHQVRSLKQAKSRAIRAQFFVNSIREQCCRYSDPVNWFK